jgi:hypothetical protein
VDLKSIQDIGELPFATLSAGVLWQVLGPTAKYLGGKGQELTQRGVENIERILTDAHGKIPEGLRDGGEVPPRVLRSVINEGAFTEDAIATGYLGGVLASSKVDCSRDDRGVVFNSMISRLSVFQLRLHYIIYNAAHYLYQGTDSNFGGSYYIPNGISFGTTGLLAAMGFNEIEFGDPEFDLWSAMTHATYGLDKEDLIDEWELDWESGLRCLPTPVGVELFLWANGRGRKNLEFFFDRDFIPYESALEAPILVPGRIITLDSGDGDEFTVSGFDYAQAISYKCALDNAGSPKKGFLSKDKSGGTDNSP